MTVMPEMIMHTINKSETKTCIIGRSPRGAALLTFENESMARDWLKRSNNKNIKFFKQTISEEEVQIDI